MNLIDELARETFRVYAILIGIYFGLGFALTRLNRFFPRIQNSECPAALVRRDRRQSVVSLLSISLFVGGGAVLHGHGIGFAAPRLTALSVAWTLPASLLIFDAWFYWGHRLIHTRPLFRRVHRWHHVSRTPTVWSNNSDTFLDNCFLQSYFLVAHFLLPIHPHVLLAHKVFDQITGMIGHSGHEYTSGRMETYPSPLLATVFHDQHHEHSNYNYATHFSVWDRLMGTLHPDYESRLKELTARRAE